MSDAHFGPRGSVIPGTPVAGDAGSDFVSGMLDAPLSLEGAKNVSAGGAQLKALASNGGFAVNEEGFQAFLKACNFFLDGYKSLRRDVDILSRSAQMGSSDYAKQVAAYNVTVAAGDHQSMIPILEMMEDGVKQAVEAITIARKNYRNTDEAHNISFSKLNKEIESR